MLGRLPDVFKSLNAHEVRYVVIGGVAAIVHGVPRTTFDVDLLIEASEGNAGRLLAALRPRDHGLQGCPPDRCPDPDARSRLLRGVAGPGRADGGRGAVLDRLARSPHRGQARRRVAAGSRGRRGASSVRTLVNGPVASLIATAVMPCRNASAITTRRRRGGRDRGKGGSTRGNSRGFPGRAGSPDTVPR